MILRTCYVGFGITPLEASRIGCIFFLQAILKDATNLELIVECFRVQNVYVIIG